MVPLLIDLDGAHCFREEERSYYEKGVGNDPTEDVADPKDFIFAIDGTCGDPYRDIPSPPFDDESLGLRPKRQEFMDSSP